MWATVILIVLIAAIWYHYYYRQGSQVDDLDVDEWSSMNHNPVDNSSVNSDIATENGYTNTITSSNSVSMPTVGMGSNGPMDPLFASLTDNLGADEYMYQRNQQLQSSVDASMDNTVMRTSNTMKTIVEEELRDYEQRCWWEDNPMYDSLMFK
jgi:hypothetical protein